MPRPKGPTPKQKLVIACHRKNPGWTLIEIAIATKTSSSHVQEVAKRYNLNVPRQIRNQLSPERIKGMARTKRRLITIINGRACYVTDIKIGADDCTPDNPPHFCDVEEATHRGRSKR